MKTMVKTTDNLEEPSERDGGGRKLSLKPLEFEDAVSSLLGVPPPPKPEQGAKKRPARKPKPRAGRKSAR